MAAAIPENATPEEVAQLTAKLGAPRVSYSWCNSAGCVDDVRAARANRMWASWSITYPNAGAKDDLSLSVTFCGGKLQEWRAHDVTVKRWPGAPGALGTPPKSEKLHDRSFGNVERCFAK